MTDFYARLDYQEYKEFEAQLESFKALETSHTSTEGFYHNSFRMKLGNMSLEVHGPLVMAGEPERHQGAEVHPAPPGFKSPDTPPSGEHIHTHNGKDDCRDYTNCRKCHCHLQDERHTPCCRPQVVRKLLEVVALVEESLARVKDA